MQVIKVPGINGLGRTEGCRNAGNAIIKKLDEIYTSERGKPIDRKLLDLEEIHVDNGNVEEQDRLIYENAMEELEKQDKIIFLGGDHSVSYPLARAFLEHCNKNEKGKEPCLIVFDAHPDCMPAMKEPTHEEWLRAVIEQGFPAKNVLLVGVRNSWKDEIVFLSKNKIRQVSINQLNYDIEGMTDVIMGFASGKCLYVSLDIDIIDPAFAPATNHPEPAGLTGRQLVYIMQRIAMMKNLKAVDIVEIDSEKDKKHDSMTTKLGARILAEMI